MGEKLLNAYGIEVQLTREQNACIEYTGNKTLIIKGLAGTGKSLLLAAIAMKRYRECAAIRDNNIAIFTYQESLIPTIQEVLYQNEIPPDAIYVGTILSYANQVYKGLVARKLVPNNEYFQENSYDLKKKKNFIKKALLIFQQKHRSHYFTEINIDIWVEEFNWIKDMNIWIENRQYFLKVVDDNTKIKYHMSQYDKELLFDIYCLYCDLLVETNQAEYIDQILTINRSTEQLGERERFDYILLDEAQEYSNTQIQFLHYLTNQTMYMAMDINQKLYEKTWSMQQLGLQYVIKKLSQSLRMTNTIDELAESLRIQNDQYLSVEDRILNVSSKREGILPQIIHFTEDGEEKAYVQQIIKRCLLDNGSNTIGIIASTILCLETYQEWLTEASIPFEVITPITPYSCNSVGVKIVTVYGAKGLEFDYVMIPQFIEGVFPFAFYIYFRRTRNIL